MVGSLTHGNRGCPAARRRHKDEAVALPFSEKYSDLEPEDLARAAESDGERWLGWVGKVQWIWCK